MISCPTLEHVCDLHVALGPVREMGAGRAGRRRIVLIVGGRVEGERLSGRILDLGADWQTVWGNGCAELDTRYAFESDDGALIEVINYGYRHGPADVMARLAAGDDCDPALYYMRTHARLETVDERYGWVNRTLFVGSGARRPSSVEIALFAIL